MNTADQIAGVIGDFLNPIINSPALQASVRLAGLGLVILWFATALWAFRDAWSRTHNVVAVLAAPMVIVAATPVGFPLAVLVWRILRPQRTIAEAREQDLTIEALHASTRVQRCAACRSKVDAEWCRCPWCRTWLMAPCPRCERLVELSAAVCPWCVTDLAPGSLVPRVGMPALVPETAASAMLPVVNPSVIQPVAAVPADLAAVSASVGASEAGLLRPDGPAPQVATAQVATTADEPTAAHPLWTPASPAVAAAPDGATVAAGPLWTPEPPVPAEAPAMDASPRQPLWAPEPVLPIDTVAPIGSATDAVPSARDALWSPEPVPALWAEPAEPAHRAPRGSLWVRWGAKARAWVERMSAPRPSRPRNVLWGPEAAPEPGTEPATVPSASAESAVDLPEASAESAAAVPATSAVMAEATTTAATQEERTTTVEPASLLGPNPTAAIPETAFAPSATRRVRRPRGRAAKQDPSRTAEEAASSSTALW